MKYEWEHLAQWWVLMMVENVLEMPHDWLSDIYDTTIKSNQLKIVQHESKANLYN